MSMSEGPGPRLAVLADVHANLAALEAVLADAAAQGATGYILAGDMAGGPQLNAVAHRVANLAPCWAIRGNNENYLLRLDAGLAPAGWYTSSQWGFVRWNYRQASAETLSFFRSLPEQCVINLPGTAAIRVVHGSPRSVSELIYPESAPEPFELALAQTGEPVLVFGHTHLPWVVRRNGRLALNPGAVSAALNGDPRAQYALIEWDGRQWRVEHRAAAYDLDALRHAFEESGLLEAGGGFSRAYLFDILHAQNSLTAFLEHAYRLAAEAGYSQPACVPDDIWERAGETFDWAPFAGNSHLPAYGRIAGG